MKREFLDYIEDIVSAMSNAEAFTEGMQFEDFARDNKSVYAAVRALEIIGEAVRKVPASVRNRYPAIPWKEMAGMRDKLIHEYFGVDLETVWETVKANIPKTKPLIKRILKSLTKEQ